MVSPIPLTVIGGFLGAGKTTLLNHLLSARLDRRIAVLVNDFGAINIDIDLIESHNADTINLANGCICCSIADGLMQTLLELRRCPDPPEHIIIEASGVADPWKIAQFGLAGRSYRLDGVIVLADAETVREQAQDPYIGETIQQQLKAADILLLNKCDLVSSEQKQAVLDWLAECFPQTQIIATVQAAVEPDVLLGIEPERLAIPTDDGHHTHETQFQRWSFSAERPFQAEALRALLDRLPDGILRAKGWVWLDETPRERTLLQRVGKRWRLLPDRAWEDGETPQSTIVVLGLPDSFTGETLYEQFNTALIDRSSSIRQNS